MPHNNLSWSVSAGKVSNHSLRAQSNSNLASWDSESDSELDSAAVSLHPRLPTPTSYAQNQKHPHTYLRQKTHQQHLLQQQLQQGQAYPNEQQYRMSSTHVQDQKFFYATATDRPHDRSRAGINGSGNHIIRASNSSAETNPDLVTGAGETMQIKSEGFLYLQQQSGDGASQFGSFSQGQQKQQEQLAASTNLSQGLQSSSSPGFDGQSLYCTEVLPVETPPSQPITVEGGGNSGRGFVSINGEASVSQPQPVQYTIVLADPHQQHQQHQQHHQSGLLGGGTTSALVSTTNTTSILLNTLAQQQHQHYPQLRNQNIASGVGLTPGVTPKSASVSPVTNLVVNRTGLSNSKFDGAFINTSNHANNTNVSAAVLAYPISLTRATSSQTLLINTAENGVRNHSTEDNHIKVATSNHIQQTAAVLGHGSGIDPARLGLVEQLPEAVRGLGAAASGFVLVTYAPAGSGDVKGGSAAVADIASIAQIQGLNVHSSDALRVLSQSQASFSAPISSSSSSSTSVEPSDTIKVDLCKQNTEVLVSVSKGDVRLPVGGGHSSLAASQESNLSNHIRVLSAAVRSSSSSNSVGASGSTPESTKLETGPILTGARGVWTSPAQSSSSLTSHQSAPSVDLHQRQIHGSRASSPPHPSILQRQQINLPRLEHRHSPDAASDGAPGGMHSGRAGQTGSGQHPHGISSSSTNTGGNIHHRNGSPVDCGPASNLTKATSASPASNTSSSSSPPYQHHQHQLPQPHTSLGMLSAGPPTIPAGLFRTGGESPSGSRLPGGSSSASYAPSPYTSLYAGIHQPGGQSTAAHAHPHLQGLAPYHTFFPGSAAAAGSLHGFAPGSLMAPSASSPAGAAPGAGAGHPYPRIESYSAVLSSMGSQALQASSGSSLDRSIRLPSSGVALPSIPGRGVGSYLPSSATRGGHSFPASGISTGLPSPSSVSSPTSSGVHRRLSGGSSSPSPGHGTSGNTNNNGSVLPGSRLSPLDKMAAMKAGGAGIGRENSSRLAYDSSDDRGSRPSPPSGHGLKVSFDSVVKEYGGDSGGGGGDSPTTPGYLRASLSGKEGSLKHRILTRPSDSEPPSGEDSPGSDRERRSSQQQHVLIRDEPAHKRAKYSSSPLPPTSPLLSGGTQPFHGREESSRGNSGSNSRSSHQHHVASHHQHSALSGSSTSTTSNHGSGGGYHTGGLSSQAGTSHLPPPHTNYQPHAHQQQTSHYQQQRYHGQPLQGDISGNNNTTTVNKNTRDSSGSSSIQHQAHSSYHGIPTSTPSRRRPSSSSTSPPAHDLPAAPRSPPPQLPPPSQSSSSSHLQYPQHFMKGSIIQLADGSLKRVEDLQTEDFVSSAQVSTDLKVDSSTVVRIEEHQERGTAMLSFSVGEHRVQVTVEATLEHPFFVFGQGWSSCSVTRTLARYGLDCQKLNVGDVCISLTHKDVSLNAADISQQQLQQQGVASQHNNGSNKQGQWDSESNSDSADRSIPSLTSTPPNSGSSQSSLPSPPPPISSSSLLPKPSSAMAPLKIDTKDVASHDHPVLPPPSSSPSTMPSLNKRQQQQQQELPPPMSNFVPVKKESSTSSVRDYYHHHHHHHSRRRSAASSSNIGVPTSWQRPSGELSSVECKEEMEGGGGDGAAREEDSMESISRKRRWSAPDPGLVKVEKEREQERQQLADQAQRSEERDELGCPTTNTRGDDTSTGASDSSLAETSTSASSSSTLSLSTAK